ncbi:hypothetical protein KFL_003040090 [Klebsormidium nitens]|uniref:Uncharacterized protein n=1 Tax=Klebsormidium nitens TaxID=105231 RepID=A0A1Y1I9P6_KLENI|nr:hypothetical protein KFL_003040090 [Klebsormidium nitens]|eukprot:GAQ86682.1 hypothetical protein KFL_003040090 [Klebsormidium nitens]
MAVSTVYSDEGAFFGSGKRRFFDRRTTLNTFLPQSNVSWLGVSHVGHSRGEAEIYMFQDEGLEDPSSRGPPGAFQGSRGGFMISGDASLVEDRGERGLEGVLAGVDPAQRGGAQFEWRTGLMACISEDVSSRIIFIGKGGGCA